MSAFLTKYWRRYFDFWLQRRLPRVSQITLNQRSVFTFPSRTGLGFIGVLALMWLLATNYENNVVFVFAALLGAVFVVTIFHSYANLAGVSLRIVQIEAGFPGDKIRVDVEVSQQDQRYRDGIWLKFGDGSPQPILSNTGDGGSDQRRAVVSLYLDARRRGKIYAGRLTVETVYPLGLIRVWSHVLLDGWGVVYPQPIAASRQHSGVGDSTDFASDEIQGAEDFNDLSPYRAGEPYNRIAWKQLARGQGLYSKHFVDPVADPQWLDWSDYPGLDREARLSRLCADVLQAATSGRPYGLKLPGEQSALGQGEKHRQQLLRSLALFEWEHS
ncbi:MAG: DUF58 domain-containing protein [Porticoccaceae bacterium]|nr:DUF58 domain-containing protein [Porticoccaceae bacterium]